MSLGQTSIRIKATHYTEIPDKCNIYLGSQYGNYEVFSFDIKELKMATEVLEQISNDIVVCVSLNEYKVKQWCMARKRDSDQYISMSQYKQDIQSIKDLHKTTIDDLKFKNEQLKQKIQHYEAKEEMNMKRREYDLKEDEYSLKREQIKVEVAKLLRETKKLDTEADNQVPEKLTLWAKCVKFITDAISAVVNIFDIFKKKDNSS
jgi:parvulin-like peptidyl-prolyl isomerase